MEPKTILGLIVAGLIIAGIVLLVLWRKGIIFKKDEDSKPDTVKNYLTTFNSTQRIERFESTDKNAQGIDDLYSRYKFAYDLAKTHNLNICYLDGTEKNNMETVNKMMNSLVCLMNVEIEEVAMVALIIMLTFDGNKHSDDGNLRQETKFEYDPISNTVIVGKNPAKFIFDREIDGIETKALTVSYEEFKNKILAMVKTKQDMLKSDPKYVKNDPNCFNENRCLRPIQDPK